MHKAPLKCKIKELFRINSPSKIFNGEQFTQYKCKECEECQGKSKCRLVNMYEIGKDFSIEKATNELDQLLFDKEDE